MKVLVVLPPAIKLQADVTRRIDWVRQHFAGADVVVAADADAAADAEVVVLVRGDSAPERADVPPAEFNGRLYVQERDGRLALQNRPFDEAEIGGIDAHVFSRMASRTTAGYYYFPYGYAAHYPGMGPVDSFGFRGAIDWNALRDRDSSHKVVAVSGGSAVWSQCCLPDEAFPAVLERMLNDWSGTDGHGVRYTVLNLGMFGNLVLHQMLNYLLFAERVRPEYVVAHDGFNDLIFGLMSDPWLLAEHSIAYQREFEEWARLLHPTPDEFSVYGAEPIPVVNLPHVAIRAYVERKEQFRRLVEGSGAAFIWGFQPCIFSKGALSPEEHAVVNTRHPLYDAAHRKLEFVYEQFATLAHLPADATIVDCHAAFKAVDDGEHLFYDHVHATPAGDRRIAELYFNTLLMEIDADA